MSKRFADRLDAAQLASVLSSYARQPHVIVLGLLRGGVPIAAHVAGVLQLPCDLLVVRKPGVPLRRELAMGAITRGRVQLVNRPARDRLGVSAQELSRVVACEQRELARRERLYRGHRPPLAVEGAGPPGWSSPVR